MAKYTSRYKELTFYVGGERRQFAYGAYETDDKATIDVLDTLSDVAKVVEEKPAKVEETKPKAEPKPTTTQKAKAPAKK